MKGTECLIKILKKTTHLDHLPIALLNQGLLALSEWADRILDAVWFSHRAQRLGAGASSCPARTHNGNNAADDLACAHLGDQPVDVLWLCQIKIVAKFLVPKSSMESKFRRFLAAPGCDAIQIQKVAPSQRARNSWTGEARPEKTSASRCSHSSACSRRAAGSFWKVSLRRAARS